jgi:hypothetical protein
MFLLFKDGLLRSFLLLGIFVFIFRGVLLLSLILLSLLVNFKGFEVSSMVSLELFFSLFDHFSTVFISVGRLLDQAFTVLTCLFAHGLTSGDVLFTGLKGELKPLEDLSEGWVIGVDGFLVTTLNDFSAVVEGLVHLERASLLSEDLVVFHGSR